jgi:hypothetical protein
LKSALPIALLLGFAGSSGAQDATGLGGLPQGKSGAVRAKTMSLPAAYAFGARSVQAPLAASPDSAPDTFRHQFMPTFHGLTAENISLRRNGIRFKYSFE